MRTACCILVLLTGVLGVFAAVIEEDADRLLLPEEYRELVREADGSAARDRQLENLLSRYSNRRWKLPPEFDAAPHGMFPPGTYRIPVPAEMAVERVELPDDLSEDAVDAMLARLFARHAIRYTEGAYQRMRWREENKLAAADQERGLVPADGWSWDISRDVRMTLRGSQDIDISYGFDSVNQNLREGANIRRVDVRRDLRLAQNLNINLIGRVGPRISITIDHNSQRRENNYDIRYSGQGDEFIKEIVAGNIDLSIPGSKYVVVSGGSKAAFGLKGVFGKGALRAQAMLSLTRGVSETKTFRGQRSERTIALREVGYVKNVHYTVPDRTVDLNSLLVYQTTKETNLSVRLGDGYYRLLVAGRDYAFDRTSGRFELTRPLTRDQNLLVLYTVGGADVPGTSHPFPPFAAHELLEESGRRYLYLKRIGYYSRFERKGIYRLGYQNLDLTRGFEFSIVNTSDGARSPVQFSPSEYRLDPRTGVLEFYADEPFQGKPGIGENLYHSPIDPQNQDSVYSLAFSFSYRVDTFQLQFNVIEGSERVYLNGTLLRRDIDYRIEYMTGMLSFIVLVNENDQISVSYEYQPFTTAMQRTLFGLRADFNPLPGFSLGSTLVYSGGQKPTGAPTPVAPPDSSMVFGVDTRLDFPALFGRTNDNLVFRLEGEVAHSVHDRNTVGRALLADMEGDGVGFALTRSEERWQLASPSPHIPGLDQSTRGRLLYRDYRDYGFNNSFVLQSYRWSLPREQILSYGRKPGPYTVQGGRNESTAEITENSIVFEYDFSEPGRNWVSAVVPVAGTGGIDFSRVNELLLSLRHQRMTGTDGNGNALYTDETGGEVRLSFDLGRLNEDADGDGVLDREASLVSSGFEFNPAGNEATWIGGGRRGGGNGILNSEDLDGDNILLTNESSLRIPSDETTGYADLVIPSGGGWQEHSLALRNLTPAALAILERVSAVRVTLVGTSGARGRVLVDRAYFKGSRWEGLEIDGQAALTADEFSAAIISTRENADYRADRLYLDFADDFEKLHGSMSRSEEEQFNEKALQLRYRLSNQARVSNRYGSLATVTRKYNSNMDLTSYRQLILYLYVKEKAGHEHEHLVFRIGSAADRYYQWRVPLVDIPVAAVGDARKWRKLQFMLLDDDPAKRFRLLLDGRDLGAASTSARPPSLREINQVTVGVDVTGSLFSVNSGELWLNEVHLYDDESRTGTAWSVRGELGYKGTDLFAPWGIPVIGPFSLKVDRSSVGNGFAAIGQAANDEALTGTSASASLTLFRRLSLTAQYADERRASLTDPDLLPLYMQYASSNQSYRHTLAWNDPRGFFPGISHAYTRVVQSEDRHYLANADFAATNDIVVDTRRRQFSEGATFEIKGSLPLGIGYGYSINDTYYLTDVSLRTNDAPADGGWFTNQSSQSYENFSKKESLTLSWNLDRLPWLDKTSLRLSGTFNRDEERFNRDMTTEGFRERFAAMETRDPVAGYLERMGELFSGIGNLEQAMDGTNFNQVGTGYTMRAELRNLAFLNVDYSLTRNLRDANFQYLTNQLLPLRNNITSAQSALRLQFVFPKFLLRTLTAQLDRDFSFSQTAGSFSREQVWDTYSGGFFRHPFHYLGLLGIGGRANDIDFVRLLAEDGGNSSVRLRNSLNLGARFDFGDNLAGDLVPDNWQFVLNQDTARNLQSYLQSRNWSLTTTKNIPLRKLRFWIFDEAGAPGKSVQDLNLRLSYGRKYDYNRKTIEDTLGGALGFSIRWNRDTAFGLSYQLERSDSRQSLFSTDPGYVYLGLGNDTGPGRGDSFGDIEEQPDGSPPGYTELPPFARYSHQIRIDHSFPTSHSDTLNLFGLKIPLDTHWRHKSELVLRFADSAYERARSGRFEFSELFDRTFFASLRHSIDYDFSQSWNGVLYLLMIFEHWRLLRPSLDGDSLINEGFDLSFGMEIGLKMLLRF